MVFPRRHMSSTSEYTRRDHHQEVTDQIITALENGVVPWRRPWRPELAGRSALPRNAATGRKYNGINVLMLALSPFAWGTEDNRWCSYRQAAAKGWQVRKGERGTRIFFFRKIEARDGSASEEEGTTTRAAAVLRAYTVFHASQVDGIAPEERGQPLACVWRRPEAVDVIVREAGATVCVGGPRAFYRPASDHIQMPPHETFVSAGAFAATMLHEMAHWSGASHRLDRDLTGQFGTARYASEELIAELSSTYMAAELGVPCEIPNHASYIAEWLTKLRDDKREIFRAASAAQRVADYLLAFHPDYQPDGEVDAIEDGGEDETKLAA